MASEKFCLRWNDFESNISTAFRELRDDKDFFDVTLACDDEQIQAHKVILSACSPFFRGVLRRNPHAHPLLYLKGVKYTDLQSVLNFMYHGEVNVAQEELNSFLAVAEELRVKGLTQNNQSSSNTSTLPKKDSYSAPRPPVSAPHTAPRISDPVPPPKKPRPAPPSFAPQLQEDDDIQEVLPTVKTEPLQQAAAATAEPQYQEQGGQLMQQDDGMGYDEEGYEDYGQYGGEEGAYEGTLVDADGNKGPGVSFTDPEELFQFVRKYEAADSGQYKWSCSICHKRFISRIAVRNHCESIHFPGMFKYNCEICQKEMTSKSSLNYHVTIYHNKPKYPANNDEI